DFIDRKNGRKPIEYLHPRMEPILSKTYGIIVHQVSCDAAFRTDLAGSNFAQSDVMRRDGKEGREVDVRAAIEVCGRGEDQRQYRRSSRHGDL
ncbi:MAG: hypothetical protein IPM83_11560, partial [Ignavibacteria bacterium]|nr:hypothetical protein [Ignavibacteria bacterium]